MVASSSSGSRDGATSGRRGGGGGAAHHAVKKGPWTAAEDAILMEYVRKHGEGNWNAVQRNSGLMRCGKSCRLRWANHLRPNLRKGAFSAEEERLIIELHAKLGNKWARMASQLPGRTDNEIKNYWNTRVKRLQRAGLPIYPDDIQRQNDHPQLIKRHSSLLSPPPPSNSKFNSPSFSLFTPPNFPTIANPFLYHPNNNNNGNNNNSQFKLNSNFTLPILPFSSSPPPSSLFSQNFINNDLLDVYPSQYKSPDFNPFGLELPSVQSSAIRAVTTTPASSGTTGGDYMMGTENDHDCDRGGGNNSGLLEELLEESKAMASAEKLKRELSFGDDGIEDVDEYSSSAHPSIDVKEEQLGELNPIDDDLSSLLNNFPMSGAVPDWPEAAPARSDDEQSSNNIKNDNLAYNNNLAMPSGVEQSPDTAAAVENPKWGMGSCCWNNMPSIC